MDPIDPAAVRKALEAIVLAFSLLAGTMAYLSGWRAAGAFPAGESPQVLSQQIDVGVAQGFILGAPAAMFGFMIVVWS